MYTHIWDIDEYVWFLDHPDMILTVPACGEYRQGTREHKICYLTVPEAMLPRGSHIDPKCPVCSYINMQIKQGTTQDPDVWADLVIVPIGEL